MARRLFATGRLPARWRAAATGSPPRIGAAPLSAASALAVHDTREPDGGSAPRRSGFRRTFAVGRLAVGRPGRRTRAVQFVDRRPSPFPGPWSLAAVVTTD